MIAKTVNRFFNQVPGLGKAGMGLAHAVHSRVLGGGEPARDAADVLHGTWLGHPLHPVLTDVVVGSWSLAALFDLISVVSTTPSQAERTADRLTTIGTAAAVPTALSGLADFSTIPKPAAGTGLVHALLNEVSILLYLSSWWSRRKGDRRRGLLLSSMGLGLSTLAAYLGGHLVYDQKVGVNHGERVSEPKTWTAVLDKNDLPENTPKCIEVAGNSVLLFRRGNRLHAVGAICPHAGGPLQEGEFKDGLIQCPWHDSVFRLRDGRVKHGPSAYALPHYEARTRQGQVEIRASG